MQFRYILALACLCLQAADATAEDYPNKPVRVLVPAPSDSAADRVARIVTPGLSMLFGQQFIVDNRSGSDGMLGTELASKATPDGYTLVIGTPATLTTAQHGQHEVPYDSQRDFAPIGLISSGPYLLAAHPSLAVTTVPELVTLAKAKPGKLTYGSAGNGSTNQIAMELFKRMADVDIRHVPYKGDLQATDSLVSGQVSLSMLSIAPVIAHVKARRVRAIAVTGFKRVTQLPRVPTVDESGLKGFEVMTWYGLLAPASTPSPIVARLAAALQKVVRQPETRKALERQGIEPAKVDPVEFAQLIQREMALYRKLRRIPRIRFD